MKGYFSKLAQHTGLNFDAGAQGVLNSRSSEPTADASREGREEMAPLEVEATTLSDSRAPVTAGESFDNVAAPAPDDAFQESAPLNRWLDPAISPDPAISLEASITTTNYESSSASNADSFQSPEPASAPERQPLGHSAEARDFTFTESADVTSPAPVRTGRPMAGVRQIIPSTEEPTLEKENFARGAPSAIHYSLVEISPRASPEEFRNRFEYSDSSSSEPRFHFGEPASEPGLIEFLENQSPVPQVSAGTQLAKESAEARQLEAKDQEILQPDTEAALPVPVLRGRSEQETAIRNYMREVRAWVAASPVDEGALEQDDGSDVWAEPGNVFSFEHKTNAAAVSHRELSADLRVDDLSLSIGNISVVIEAPQKDAPPPAAPPPTDRSPVETASEPTSLSRYYLRSW